MIFGLGPGLVHPVPEIPGRGSESLFICLGKVARGVIPDLIGDLRYGKPRILESVAGFVQAFGPQVFEYGHAVHLFETPVELWRRHAGLLGEFPQRDRRFHIADQEILCLFRLSFVHRVEPFV